MAAEPKPPTSPADRPAQKARDFDVELEWPAEEPGPTAAEADGVAADDRVPPRGAASPEHAPLSGSLVTLSGLPASVRADTIHGALSSLGLRIDALVSANSTNRVSITDRLNDHVDTIGRLLRSQLGELADAQETNERTLGEVRRALADSEDLLRRVNSRLDHLHGEIGALHAGQQRVEEVADAIARFEASVEVLPHEGARPDNVVLARLEARVTELGQSRSDPALLDAVERLEARLDATGGPGPAVGLGAELAVTLEDLRSELAAVRRRVDGLAQPEPPEELVELRDEVRALRHLLDSAAPGQGDAGEWRSRRDVVGGDSQAAAMEAVHAELVALRRRISVRAKPAEVQLDDAQAAALADAVVERLRAVLEVVPDDETRT